MTVATNLDNLVDTYVTQIDEVEAMMFDVLTKTLSIADAEGAQLDLIGKIIGQPRHGETDVVYRISLNTKILINQAEGTNEEIIEIVDTIAAGASTITIVETFPAHFELTLDDTVTQAVGVRSSAAVFTVKPAGVRGIVRWDTDATSFGFLGTAGAEGFDTDPLTFVGGEFSTAAGV